MLNKKFFLFLLILIFFSPLINLQAENISASENVKKIIQNKIPENISSKIISLNSKVENFRIKNLEKITIKKENLENKTKEEIKNLEKLKIIFYKLSLVILESQFLFYTIIFLIIFLIIRFIWIRFF